MKKQTKEQFELCRIVTCEFRLSHPHLFEAQSPNPKDTKKFSLQMLFSKKKEMMGTAPDGAPRTLRKALRNAAIIKYGPKEDWPEGLQFPIRDGDADPKLKDKEGNKGHWVVKATSNEDHRPTLVGRAVDEYTGKLVVISDSAELYPGCYCRAHLLAYPWEFMGKEGIGFIVDHVQKLRDGKPLGGKKSADQVFSPLEDEDETPEEDEEEIEDL